MPQKLHGRQRVVLRLLQGEVQRQVEEERAERAALPNSSGNDDFLFLALSRCDVGGRAC